MNVTISPCLNLLLSIWTFRFWFFVDRDRRNESVVGLSQRLKAVWLSFGGLQKWLHQRKHQCKSTGIPRRIAIAISNLFTNQRNNEKSTKWIFKNSSTVKFMTHGKWHCCHVNISWNCIFERINFGIVNWSAELATWHSAISHRKRALARSQ